MSNIKSIDQTKINVNQIQTRVNTIESSLLELLNDTTLTTGQRAQIQQAVTLAGEASRTTFAVGEALERGFVGRITAKEVQARSAGRTGRLHR